MRKRISAVLTAAALSVMFVPASASASCTTVDLGDVHVQCVEDVVCAPLAKLADCVE